MHLMLHMINPLLTLLRWKAIDPDLNRPDLGPEFESSAPPPSSPEDASTDLAWSAVLKRTCEEYIRGERPNMYGEVSFSCVSFKPLHKANPFRSGWNGSPTSKNLHSRHLNDFLDAAHDYCFPLKFDLTNPRLNPLRATQTKPIHFVSNARFVLYQATILPFLGEEACLRYLMGNLLLIANILVLYQYLL